MPTYDYDVVFTGNGHDTWHQDLANAFAAYKKANIGPTMGTVRR